MPPNDINIIAIQEDSMVVALNGKQHRISKDFESLRQFVLQTNHSQVVAADNIYNVNSINEATFNIITETFKLPHRLSTDIPRLNKNQMVGREDDLYHIRHLLNDQQVLVVVNAMGGLGKTTLLQAYIDTYYYDYQHVLWVKQSEHQSLSDAFINTKGLMSNLGIDLTNTNPASWFDQILNQLHGISEHPNLLVIDNAHEDLANYRHLIPNPPNWHVLISSREHISGYASYSLEELSPDKALELFNRYYTRNKIDQTDQKKLLEMVEYHTLTIELLAKTAQLMRLDAQQLFRTLNDDQPTHIVVDHLSDKTQPIERVMSYLTNIFDLSQISSNALYLLQQFVYLPSTYIPYEHLQILLCTDNSPIKHQLSILLQQLCDKGWLYANIQADTYHIHAIIAQIIQQTQGIGLETAAILLDQVATQLDVDQKKDNPIDKFVWIPYGERLAQLFNDHQDIAIHVLQNNLAMVLRVKGSFKAAKELLHKSMLSAEKNFGLEHPTTLISYSNLATALQDLGEYEEAKLLLQKNVMIAEKNIDNSELNIAINYTNLATVLKDLGQYEEARVLFEKAMLIDQKRLGEDHPNNARNYSNLATVLQNLGEYDAAKQLLQKAVVANEKSFGIHHPTTAIRYSNLAKVLKDLGEYDAAQKLLQKAVQIDEKNFGNNHPSTAKRYVNLALVLQDTGQYQTAKELLQKALAVFQQSLPPEHPIIAANNANLALVLRDLGEYQTAKELLQKVVQTDEKNFGYHHPTTATDYVNFALVLLDLTEYDAAKELLQQALAIFQQSLPPLHPVIATVYASLGLLYHKMAEQEQARELLQQALAIFQQSLPPEHPSIAAAYDSLALVLRSLGDYHQAKELLQKAISSSKTNFGAEHITTATYYNSLALVLQDLGEEEQARELRQQALAIFQQNLPPEHPNIVQTKEHLLVMSV